MMGLKLLVLFILALVTTWLITMFMGISLSDTVKVVSAYILSVTVVVVLYTILEVVYFVSTKK